MNRPLHVANVLIFGVASSAGPRPLGVEWSLDIEAQFYLLLPLLVTVRPAWWLIFPATAIGWLAWRLTGISNVFMYLPAFAAGMVCYRYRTSHMPVSWQAALTGFIFLTVVIALSAPGRAMINSKIPDVMNEDIFAMIWGLPLIFYVAHSLRIKSGPFDRHLGNLSFPLYLVQEPIIQSMHLAGITAKGLIIAVAGLAALLLYAAIDVPLENARYAFLTWLKERLTAQPSSIRQSSLRGLEEIQAERL